VNAVFTFSGSAPESIAVWGMAYTIFVFMCFSNYFGVFALFFMTGLAIVLSYTPGLAVALKLYPLM